MKQDMILILDLGSDENAWLARKIRAEFEAYASKGIKLAPDIASTVATNDDVGFLSDFIAFNIPVPVDDKQYILEQLNVVTRAKITLELLGKEAEICYN